MLWTALSLFFAALAATPTHDPAVERPLAQTHTIAVGDKAFPRTTDLSRQFAEVVPKQVGGTCAAYSCVALLEAACFRVLGKKLRLSEGYAVYLAGRPDLTLESLGWTPDPWGERSDTFPGRDHGANVTKLLKQIVEGKVALDETLSMERDFLPFTRALRRETGEQVAAGVPQEKALAGYLAKLDAEVLKRIGSPTTKNPELKACLSRLTQSEPIPRPKAEVLMEHLERGTPVICTGNKYGNHALIVMGYRVEKENPLTLKWLLRNSHTDKATWTWLGERPCLAIDVLEVKSP